MGVGGLFSESSSRVDFCAFQQSTRLIEQENNIMPLPSSVLLGASPILTIPSFSHETAGPIFVALSSHRMVSIKTSCFEDSFASKCRSHSYTATLEVFPCSPLSNQEIVSGLESRSLLSWFCSGSPEQEQDAHSYR